MGLPQRVLTLLTPLVCSLACFWIANQKLRSSCIDQTNHDAFIQFAMFTFHCLPYFHFMSTFVTIVISHRVLGQPRFKSYLFCNVNQPKQPTSFWIPDNIVPHQRDKNSSSIKEAIERKCRRRWTKWTTLCVSLKAIRPISQMPCLKWWKGCRRAWKTV